MSDHEEIRAAVAGLCSRFPGEYWRGLDRNGGPPSEYARNWYYDPIRWGAMVGHQPAPGEMVGFFVSAGDARNNGPISVKERSNVVLVPFPGSGGGVFGF